MKALAPWLKSTFRLGQRSITPPVMRVAAARTFSWGKPIRLSSTLAPVKRSPPLRMERVDEHRATARLALLEELQELRRGERLAVHVAADLHPMQPKFLDLSD